MRFKKANEKYTNKLYWVAAVVNRGQLMPDIFWLIYPHGSGFNVFKRAGYSRPKTKVCHVNKFESAKQIANLIQNG